MVDALCSGRSVRKDVLVRIQSWAQIKKFCTKCGTFLFVCLVKHFLLSRQIKRPGERSERGLFLLVSPLVGRIEITESNPAYISS